jgi:hypothetical protein
MKLMQAFLTAEIIASAGPGYDPAVILHIGTGRTLRFVLTPAEAEGLAQRLTEAVDELKAADSHKGSRPL